MFTGIITGVGRIAAVHDLGESAAFGKRLDITTPATYLDDVGLGDSIAINGACMTVTALQLDEHRFSIEVSRESLTRTSGMAKAGPVNLEKALRAADRLGGHIVSGHVDGIGQVTAMHRVGESWTLRVLAPSTLARFLAFKGSITINGVSLTVNEVQDSSAGCEFSINLIAHTVAHTTLGELLAGDSVNLEIDLIARYVERMLSAGMAPGAVLAQSGVSA